jgi:lipopolysaccharide/colanic/teichoic acid biosynthesis glycosyltransferase
MPIKVRNSEASLQRSSPLMIAPATSLLSGGRNVFAYVVKRCIDFIGATVLITLLLPVFVLIAALVYFEDGAPIIHRRRVLGQKGEFDAFKFRTMRRDADALLVRDPLLWAEYQRNFKLVNDPRVTRFGALLRKLSIDELPQLFNVVIGQMSLVGPRMITPAELEKYGPHKRLLLSCKPGLTGYWQVCGRQTVSYDERVRMDVYYLQNWSLGMDLVLLLRTPLKVLNMEGAF